MVPPLRPALSENVLRHLYFKGAAMTNDVREAFRLSRIYAEGWNFARMDLPERGITSNPYVGEPERTRWLEGYAKALS